MPFSTTGFVNGARRARYVSTEAITLAAATQQTRTISQFCNCLYIYATASTLVTVRDAASVTLFQGLLDPTTPLELELGISAASLALLSAPGGTLYLNQMTCWEED
jgi:hypothetical protein